MAVTVVDCFEVIQVHHQHAKRLRGLLCASSLAREFSKERFAGQQAREFVMTKQALDLLLERPIDLVEKFETKKMIADQDLVAVGEQGFGHHAPVDAGAVR